MQPNQPLLSIVIPAYNREVEIRRALASCLCQDHPSFEIIVVDDGSTDGTASAVESIEDGRIRLLRQPRNLGQGAAVNLASSQAKADWIVFLDSDDELLPGALSHMQGLVEHAAPHVHRYAFRYLRDDGRTCPFPPAPEGVLDYQGYLGWLNSVRLFDFLRCTRRVTFETVRLSEHRWTEYMLYDLDFAKRFQTSFQPDVLYLAHTDTGNRTSERLRDPRGAIESAGARMCVTSLLLERHGTSLRIHAPAKYQMFQRVQTANCFLLGMRGRGFAEWLGCLRAAPLAPEIWMILAAGMLGPEVFAKVRARRKRE